MNKQEELFSKSDVVPTNYVKSSLEELKERYKPKTDEEILDAVSMPVGIVDVPEPFQHFDKFNIKNVNYTYEIKDKFTAKNSTQLIVLGEPTAQKRHRSVRIGNFNRQYDPSASDKGDFLSIVQKNAPDTPHSVPLHVDMLFYFTRPKSHYKSGKNAHLLKDNPPEYHTSRPDSDNLIKFVMDSLNKIYWKDDSYIVSLTVQKMYSENPRTQIDITVI